MEYFLKIVIRIAKLVSGERSHGDASPKDSKFMQEFFGDVEIIKQNIAAIRNASVQLADIDQQV